MSVVGHIEVDKWVEVRLVLVLSNQSMGKKRIELNRLQNNL